MYKEILKTISLIILIISFSPFAIASSYNMINPTKSNIHDPRNSVKVFGYGQVDVLTMDGDSNGKACSMEHKDNDFSNR